MKFFIKFVLVLLFISFFIYPNQTTKAQSDLTVQLSDIQQVDGKLEFDFTNKIKAGRRLYICKISIQLISPQKTKDLPLDRSGGKSVTNGGKNCNNAYYLTGTGTDSEFKQRISFGEATKDSKFRSIITYNVGTPAGQMLRKSESSVVNFTVKEIPGTNKVTTLLSSKINKTTFAKEKDVKDGDIDATINLTLKLSQEYCPNQIVLQDDLTGVAGPAAQSRKIEWTDSKKCFKDYIGDIKIDNLNAKKYLLLVTGSSKGQSLASTLNVVGFSVALDKTGKPTLSQTSDAKTLNEADTKDNTSSGDTTGGGASGDTPAAADAGGSGPDSLVGKDSKINFGYYERGSIADKLNSDETIIMLWKVVLGLADTFVAVVLIAISFATILHIKYDTYGVKKALPPLLIGIIMAHFSLVIVKYIVDFAQVLSASFFNAASSGNGAQGFANNLAATFIGNGFNSISGAIGTSQWGSNSVNGVGSAVVAMGFFFGIGSIGIIGVIIAIVLLFIPALALIILSIMLFIRTYMIFLFAIIAPIAWLAIAWPPIEGWFKTWWTQFIKWVFIGPAVIFLLYIAIAISQQSAKITGEASSSGGTTANFFTYLLTLAMMFLAIKLPFTWGGAVGGFMQGNFKKYGGQAVGAANTGVGRWMDKVASTPTGQFLRIRGSIATQKEMYKKVREENYQKVKSRIDLANENRFDQGVMNRIVGVRQLRRLSTSAREYDNERDVAANARNAKNEARLQREQYEGLQYVDDQTLQRISMDSTNVHRVRAAIELMVDKGVGNVEEALDRYATHFEHAPVDAQHRPNHNARGARYDRTFRNSIFPKLRNNGYHNSIVDDPDDGLPEAEGGRGAANHKRDGAYRNSFNPSDIAQRRPHWYNQNIRTAIDGAGGFGGLQNALGNYYEFYSNLDASKVNQILNAGAGPEFEQTLRRLEALDGTRFHFQWRTMPNGNLGIDVPASNYNFN